MLGRMRPSSLDCLERPPPKIVKDDSLSIYEATLQKLRLGARRALNSSIEAMKIDIPCTSAGVESSSSDGQSINGLKQQMEPDSCSSFCVPKCGVGWTHDLIVTTLSS